MENVKRKEKKRQYPRWLKLSLYKNCFGENEGSHLGLRFQRNFYCITHSPGSGVIIQKKYLRMKEVSPKIEYFKRTLVTPEILHTTNMYIDEKFVIEAVLKLEMNK